MPQYTILSLANSLVVADVPVGYTPAVGPEVEFRMTYNQREANQPSIFAHSNLGKLWTHEWLNYLILDNTTTSIKMVRPGGRGGLSVRSQHADLRGAALQPD